MSNDFIDKLNRINGTVLEEMYNFSIGDYWRTRCGLRRAGGYELSLLVASKEVNFKRTPNSP